MKKGKKNTTTIKNIILWLPIFSLSVFFIDKSLEYFGLIKNSMVDRCRFWVILILLLPIVLFPIINYMMVEDLEQKSRKTSEKDKNSNAKKHVL